MSTLPQLTTAQIAARATDTSFQRGENYYRQGAIFAPVQRGDTLECFCEGSSPQPYRVTIEFSADDITLASCTCPYDWGGDCKHIIAALLMYAHEPEAFEEKESRDTALEQRSKEELIALIKEMLRREPDLAMLLDRDLPGMRKTRTTPIDTETYRRELRYAINGYQGWGDITHVRVLEDVARTASEFAAHGDFASARAICSAVLDEAFSYEHGYPFDDEGDYSYGLSLLVEQLASYLDDPEVNTDDVERRAALDSLLQATLWDLEQGGIGVSDEAWEPIMAYSKPAEIPAYRARIEVELHKQLQSPYSKWGAEACEAMLMEFDQIENVDPEVTLARLQDEGLYRLAFQKLLQMGRTDEAIQFTIEHLTTAHERIQAVAQLTQAGQQEAAIQLAEAALASDFSDRLAYWLITQYEERGDHADILRLQEQLFYQRPDARLYETLHQTAEKLRCWRSMRPQLIAWLEEQQQLEVLTRIYLDEKEWDAAWEAWQRVQQQRASARYGWHGRIGTGSLEIVVAEAMQKPRPRHAITLYVEAAKCFIAQRGRNNYREAAGYLSIVRDLYRSLDDEATWDDLIFDIREFNKTLRALKDELNKAGL